MIEKRILTLSRLVRGARYRVTHQSETQRFPRVSVLSYMGRGGYTGDQLVFNARPVAGTTEIPESWILEIVEVDPNTPISVNERAS